MHLVESLLYKLYPFLFDDVRLFFGKGFERDHFKLDHIAPAECRAEARGERGRNPEQAVMLRIRCASMLGSCRMRRKQRAI